MNKQEQKRFEAMLENESGGKKLLLHSCCAPCSSYVLEYLAGRFDITVFYCNPNIFPRAEYEKRAAEQQRLLGILGIPYLESEYSEDIFLSHVKGLEQSAEGGARCAKCFELRLEQTAKTAAERGFDLFATTLTVSPHKNADAVNAAGRAAAEKYGSEYLESDFKKRGGYLRSLELSKQYSLYRQDYCGCRFSSRAGDAE